MDIKAFYKNRIEKLTIEEEILNKKSKRFPYYRLFDVVAIIVLLVLFAKFSLYLLFLPIILLVFIFGLIVKNDIKNSRKLKITRTLLEININEINCLTGNFSVYPNGAEHINKNHEFTSDLDIFGEHSLFQFINRTSFKISNNILAEWLLCNAGIQEIKLRQDAVKDLKDKVDWRQKLYAYSLIHKAEKKDPETLLKWINEPVEFLNKKFLRIVSIVLPFITLLSIVLAFSVVHPIIPAILLSIQLLINYKVKFNIDKIYNSVTKNSDLLNAYSDIIKLVKTEKFSSEKLNDIKTRFNSPKQSIYKSIKKLSVILKCLDFRTNALIYLFLNSFFFWDLYQIVRLEKWKLKNKGLIKECFNDVGVFEALSSFANLSFNNSDWVFPEINNSSSVIKGKDIGHPLISSEKRVNNDFEIDDNGKIVIITGSNMSGKSTFLRAVGVNIILAMAGSCVCATEFKVRHIKVITSMRIIDSLEENISTFYAELQRIQKVITTVEKNQDVLFLLDEILRGTNSNDRHIGSVALVKQLVKYNGFGIIATHDLGLSELVFELPQNIENFNFDVRVDNDELYFDYKLRKGICNSLNASLLMRKMGIKIEG